MGKGGVCLRKSQLVSVKKRVQKAGGTSHLVGSRLGCLYQPILSGFYSGDERVLKTNRTLRKKLVERMTVFLVAKPSVLLQQLTEGSTVALDLYACVFAWVAGAGWHGRREYRGGGEDVCMLGSSDALSKFAWEGRRKAGCGSVCKHMWQGPSLGVCVHVCGCAF